jgi:hypothetical protein
LILRPIRTRMGKLPMFTLINNYYKPKKDSAIFDFHFPNRSLVPGALSAGLLHQSHILGANCPGQYVDIIFLKPITEADQFTLSLAAKKSEIKLDNKLCAVRLNESKYQCPIDIIPLCNQCTVDSSIHRPPELIFHHAVSIQDDICQCVIHIDDLIHQRPFLYTLTYAAYFVVLETMGNLAMQSLTIPDDQLYVFHSFKGLYFDLSKISGELTITTQSKRVNGKIIKWSSHAVDKKQTVVASVQAGINVSI